MVDARLHMSYEYLLHPLPSRLAITGPPSKKSEGLSATALAIPSTEEESRFQLWGLLVG